MLKIIDNIRKNLTGRIPESERIHAEFTHEISGGWHINHFMRNWSLDVPFPKPDSLKVRVLFNAEDAPKFDHCPFMAKINMSIDKSLPYEYCAFIYPRGREIDPITAWVKSREFPHATVFTFGYYTKTGQWQPGAMMGAV